MSTITSPSDGEYPKVVEDTIVGMSNLPLQQGYNSYNVGHGFVSVQVIQFLVVP